MYDAPLKILLKATGRDLTFLLPAEVESRHIAVMTDAHHPLTLRCNDVAVPNYKTAGGAWADHLVFEGLAVLPDFAGDSRIKSVLQWQGEVQVICGWFVDTSPIRSLRIQSPTDVTMCVCAVMVPKVDDLTGDWRLGDDITIVGYAKGAQSDDLVCPRCGGREFGEVDCGPDGYDDDITYTSDICNGCGLWHDGWVDKWLIDVTNWLDSEDAEEFKVATA